MTKTIENIARGVSQELNASLQTLQTNLSQVEQELDLECTNLRTLVDSRDPDINRQLDALGTSISTLHESLADVRSHLSTAIEDHQQLETVTTDASEKPRESVKEDSLDPRLAARIRHDEQITLSGIFRALLMADEPQQRFQKK